ncbi:MAG: hypothetical protein K9N29_03535 [Candidatus Marinimicrobia bacterium]|nr:hypothetical protein [Candidatus Neomarinimicrobiota bacterium]
METQTKKIETKILALLNNHGELPRNELYQLLHSTYPDLKVTTFDWLLYKLKETLLIRNAGRGVYALSAGATYTPPLSDTMKHIFQMIQKRYDVNELLMWETKWLNEFMVHQPFRSMMILEADSDILDSVFYFLKDKVKNEVFLRSGFALKSASLGEFMEAYILESKNPIVVQKFIKRSPVQDRDKIKIPTLEKMLVDIFCDPILFSSYQGAEMDKIYVSAFKRFQLDRTQMLSYAARRGKQEHILEFVKSTVGTWS